MSLDFSKCSLPAKVRLVEVGPRDGLQNESSFISTDQKVRLIRDLADAGLQHIEAGSFVSPKWVPQMADSADVFAQLKNLSNVRLAALTPNFKGLQAALQAGVSEVAVFASASEGFSQKNINCSVAESIERFKPVLVEAKSKGLPVRGYVSCVMGCPYDGDVPFENVKQVTECLLDLGCYEVSLGDTIGVGTPQKVQDLLSFLLQDLPVEQLAVHFHDTYGQALANIFASLQMGISVVDTSVAGLGGCPYAGEGGKAASGNVATEDVLYMLNGLNIDSGVDLDALVSASRLFCDKSQLVQRSKVSLARQR